MTTAIIAGLVSLILTIIGMPQFMKYYQRAKIGGQQMHEDVKQHIEKAGTPTMGGTVFILVSALVTLIFSLFIGMTNGIIAMLTVLIIYGLVGFLDDFLKIFKKINEGLKPYQKLALQIVAGLIFYFLYSKEVGSEILNLFGYQLHLGIVYAIFVLFWLVGFSNAVNLTDGIDGLASISVVISLLAYSVIALVQRQYDVLMFIFTVIGGLLGFFVFNHKPAKVFMGDVGSLALGAMLATLSIWLHQEWTLLLIGLVYVLETASVMLQVSYFKWTKKRTGEGKRIFRMTPLHHHFELGGFSGQGEQWSEWKVDFLFWFVGLVMSLITLAILYL
jgi:phospho-N-acetylmuramoyl-pentapeptide-transferase